MTPCRTSRLPASSSLGLPVTRTRALCGVRAVGHTLLPPVRQGPLTCNPSLDFGCGRRRVTCRHAVSILLYPGAAGWWRQRQYSHLPRRDRCAPLPGDRFDRSRYRGPISLPSGFRMHVQVVRPCRVRGVLGCGSGPIQRRADLIVLSALGDGVPLGVDTGGQENVWSRELFLLVPLREASFVGMVSVSRVPRRTRRCPCSPRPASRGTRHDRGRDHDHHRVRMMDENRQLRPDDSFAARRCTPDAAQQREPAEHPAWTKSLHHTKPRGISSYHCAARSQ